MTERHGLWIGIGFASLFFGMAHVVPAHIVSAGLIGVFLHFAFIYSRSFWVPVSMHVVNNAMAFMLNRFEDALPIPGYTSDLGGKEIVHAPMPLILAGLLATIALFFCWRHFRSPPRGGAIEAAENDATPSAGLGWVLVLGLVLTQVLLVFALATSVVKS